MGSFARARRDYEKDVASMTEKRLGGMSGNPDSKGEEDRMLSNVTQTLANLQDMAIYMKRDGQFAGLSKLLSRLDEVASSFQFDRTFQSNYTNDHWNDKMNELIQAQREQNANMCEVKELMREQSHNMSKYCAHNPSTAQIEHQHHINMTKRNRRRAKTKARLRAITMDYFGGIVSEAELQ